MWEGQSLSSGMDSKLQAPIGSFKPMVAQIILAKFSGSQNNNRSHKLGKGMFRESNKGGKEIREWNLLQEGCRLYMHEIVKEPSILKRFC